MKKFSIILVTILTIISASLLSGIFVSGKAVSPTVNEEDDYLMAYAYHIANSNVDYKVGTIYKDEAKKLGFSYTSCDKNIITIIAYNEALVDDSGERIIICESFRLDEVKKGKHIIKEVTRIYKSVKLLKDL